MSPCISLTVVYFSFKARCAVSSEGAIILCIDKAYRYISQMRKIQFMDSKPRLSLFKRRGTIGPFLSKRETSKKTVWKNRTVVVFQNEMTAGKIPSEKISTGKLGRNSYVVKQLHGIWGELAIMEWDIKQFIWRSRVHSVFFKMSRRRLGLPPLFSFTSKFFLLPYFFSRLVFPVFIQIVILVVKNFALCFLLTIRYANRMQLIRVKVYIYIYLLIML